MAIYLIEQEFKWEFKKTALEAPTKVVEGVDRFISDRPTTPTGSAFVAPSFEIYRTLGAYTSTLLSESDLGQSVRFSSGFEE